MKSVSLWELWKFFVWNSYKKSKNALSSVNLLREAGVGFFEVAFETFCSEYGESRNNYILAREKTTGLI